MRDDVRGRTDLPPHDVDAALAALGRADRASAPPPAWNAFTRELDRPGLAARVPLRLATVLRPLAEFGRPAVAGTLVATLAGVALGTWLAVAFDRGPTAAALASTEYTGSTLLDGDDPGLDAYLADGTSGEVPADDTLPSGSGEAP
jgi:hypothetical protein